VLTLFESLTSDDLPHFLKLLSHLAKFNLPCPTPQVDHQANLLGSFNGKPAAIFERLSGVSTASPSVFQCHQIGLQLARFHLSTQNYIFPIKSGNDLSWCHKVLNKIGTHLSAMDLELINDELDFQTTHCRNDLPIGVIHADLFRDNVLFVDNHLTGLLDFYSACTDSLLLDIAISANDWCCDNGAFNPERLAALLSAYESLRPLQPLEIDHWPVMLRAAALRFWLSRLEHQLFPRAGEITQQKDPLVFRSILQQHQQQASLSSMINIF
jgi:homoserine kinase type II